MTNSYEKRRVKNKKCDVGIGCIVKLFVTMHEVWDQ